MSFDEYPAKEILPCPDVSLKTLSIKDNDNLNILMILCHKFYYTYW